MEYEYEEPSAAPVEKVSATLDLKYDAEHFMGEVADRAARQIVESCQRDISSSVMQRVTVEIDRQINEIVSATLGKTFQPLDAFGDAAGQPTTIKAIIAKKADDFMNEKVDSSGHATNSWSAKDTRAEFLVGKMVKEAINYTAENEIKAIAKQAKEQAHEKVAKLLLETLQK